MIAPDGGDGGAATAAIVVRTNNPDGTRDVGRRVARLLRAGDVVVLSGELGAGKTTLAQGLGAGLRVRGDVTSPTFVISRVHPSLVGGPALVHVDAYRISGAVELDDLDLDQTLNDAVTIVEWGDGLAESLAESRLELRLSRPMGGTGPIAAPTGDLGADLAAEEPRSIRVVGVGPRWRDVDLAAAVGGG